LDAQSSVQQDKDCILAEIMAGGGVDHVDAAIDVLIRSGMSTPDLREVATYGVSVENAGAYNLQFMAAGFYFLMMMAFHIGHNIQIGPMFQILLLVELLVWGASFATMAWDRRPFAVSVFLVLLVIPCCMLRTMDSLASMVSGTMGRATSSVRLYVEVGGMACLLIPLSLLLSLAGPAKVARVPRVGPRIVHACLEPFRPLATFRAAITRSNTYHWLSSGEERRHANPGDEDELLEI